jgi:hypothetical protein
MHKLAFANRFGLVASFFMVSLFPSTSAWAQKTTGTAAAQGPQQVIVTNTAAQPVPMVGLVKDGDQPARKPFQWDGDISIAAGVMNGARLVTNVPANQRLVIEHVSGWCPSFVAVVSGESYQASTNVAHLFWLPAEFANGSPLPAAALLRFYADPGTSVTMSVNLVNPSNVSHFCELSLAGYYVDLP